MDANESYRRKLRSVNRHVTMIEELLKRARAVPHDQIAQPSLQLSQLDSELARVIKIFVPDYR